MSDHQLQLQGIVDRALKTIEGAEGVLAAIDRGEIPNGLVHMPDGTSLTLREVQQTTIESSRIIASDTQIVKNARA